MRVNLLSTLRTYILTRITKTFARCWLVSTSFGTVYGFTTHTRDITFEGITYASVSGFQATDIRNASGLSTDTLSVQTFLSNAEERLIAAGVFDNAYVEMFLVNYMNLAMGKLIEKVGYIGEVPRGDGIADFELRGLTQALDTKIGRVYNILCDADLGDDRCRVDLYPIEFAIDVEVTGATGNLFRTDGGNFVEDGYLVDGVLTISNSSAGNNVTRDITAVAPSLLTVTPALNDETETLVLSQANRFYLRSAVVGVVSLRSIFTVDSSPIDDFFSLGTLTFLTGANTGFSRDIKSQKASRIATKLPFPYDIEVGDSFEMVAGCDKTLQTCVDKFDNLALHRGHPYIPVNENVFSSPILSPSTTE